MWLAACKAGRFAELAYEPPGKGGGTQRRDNCHPIRIQIEHGTDALADEEQGPGIGELNPNRQRIICLIERDLEPAVPAIERNRAPVRTALDDLNARRGARREKCQHELPLIRWTKPQTKLVLMFGLRAELASQSADLSGRPLIGSANRGIEPTHTAVAGSQSYFAHGKGSFVDELLGKV